MKHTLKTTLALLFAGVINLSAQAHEAAIAAFVSTPNVDFSSNEAVVLRDLIMAEESVSDVESEFVEHVARNADGLTTVAQLTPIQSALASKGSLRSQTILKIWSGDLTGWTTPMIVYGATHASRIALENPGATAFRAQVFDTLRTVPVADPVWLKFFKEYRLTLDRPQRIAVTSQLKDVFLSVAVRDDAQNAVLASLAADLVALQLDQ